jgi:hypothetical protein
VRGRTVITAVTVVAVALTVRFYGSRAPEVESEPARRSVIDTGIKAAAAQAGVRRAGITGSSVAVARGETPPPEECTLVWTGHAQDGSVDNSYTATVAALEERGWEVDRRFTDWTTNSTRLRHRGWTLHVVPGSLPSSDTVTFFASAPSC